MKSGNIHEGTDSASEQVPSDTEALLERVDEQEVEQRSAPAVLSYFWKQLRVWAILALVLACLEAGGNLLYHQVYYASYQPAQCLIQSEQVRYVQPSGSDNSSPYYEPDVTYQVVSPTNANPDTYPGYAGPGSFQERMPTSDAVQALLDHYQVGQTYSCWYSSFEMQPEAVLVFQPFSWWEIVLTSFATFILGFLCSLITVMLIILLLRVRRLRRKGIATSGIVAEEQLAFFTAADPSEKICVPYKTQKELGSKVHIIYDPKDPRHHFRIASPLWVEELIGSCFLLFIWLSISLVLILILWKS